MDGYPEVVAKIADDYLQRLKTQLQLVPAREQEDFLKEIQSHIYEAYQQAAGEDDVARILSVLRNLGEPGEVVADRLPGAMIRSGAKRSMPLYIVGGVLVALFGIPLGFGSAGVLVGLMCALAGVLTAFYAVAGSFLFAGAVLTLSGLVRMWLPVLWNRLVDVGFVQMDLHPLNWRLGELFDAISPGGQGLLMLLLAAVLIAGGLGMLRLGRHLLRGLRFLFVLGVDRMRRFVQTVRAKLRQRAGFPGLRASKVLFTNR